MNTSNEAIKVIKDNLMRNSEFEFIADLRKLTLADMYYIEKIYSINNIKGKFDYQIINNTYIKVAYSC